MLRREVEPELKPRGFAAYSGTAHIHIGDTLDVLRTLPPNRYQCCITSPPYYGLRDYDTARWEGGDAKCDHKPPTDWLYHNFNRMGGVGANSQAASAVSRWYKPDGRCRCGARRVDRQMGAEASPDEYIENMVEVFREVHRVLRPDGTLWLNIGDSYWKNKSLIGIPWRLALALQADGWWLRSDVIWHKPNPMPESVTDRPTKSHEYVFMMTKSADYVFHQEAVKERGVIPALTMAAKGSVERLGVPGVNARPPEYKEYDGYRNIRDVWTITTEPYEEAHFATMPTRLAELCVLASTSKGGWVLDPFGGSGTTGLVAGLYGCHSTLIELNPEYVEIARKRLRSYVDGAIPVVVR